MIKVRTLEFNPLINFKLLHDLKNNLFIVLKGPGGETKLRLRKVIYFVKKNSQFRLLTPVKDAVAGLQKKLLQNAIRGVLHGYRQYLEVRGIGYKFVTGLRALQLNIGFSSPISFYPDDSLTLHVRKTRVLKIYGCDLNLVTQTAARIRLFKKPDPYKGKGVRYLKEVQKLKEGKKKKK